MSKQAPRGYLPIDGLTAYDSAVKALVFGAQAPAVQDGRVATVQTLGGTGALKIGADFLRQLTPSAKVLVSNPSWDNHKALFVFGVSEFSIKLPSIALGTLTMLGILDRRAHV